MDEFGLADTDDNCSEEEEIQDVVYCVKFATKILAKTVNTSNYVRYKYSWTWRGIVMHT